MAEETALVQPGFLLSKSRSGRGGDKSRSLVSASPASNVKEPAAHYRRESTGLINAKSDEYDGEGRESLALRKPVKVIGGMVHKNGVGVNAVVNKKVVGNPKAVSDRKIASPVKEKGKQEHVDVDTKQSASDISLLSDENEKVTADLNLFKKSCTLSKGKPTLLRLPSLVSSGRITDARKTVEGWKSVNGKRVLESGSFDARKFAEGEKCSGQEITQKSDGNVSNVENDNNGSKSCVREMKSIEGSTTKIGLVKSKSLNMRTSVKDGGFVNIKNNGTSETPDKDIVVAKSKILSMRPSRSQTSLIHHLSGSRSKTDDDGQTGKKVSTSKLDAKPAATFSASSSTSSTSEKVEKSSDSKNVSRVVRVLSSVRRSKAEPKDIAEDVVKVATEKNSLASTKMKMTSSKALLAPSSSVTKSTVRPRTSYPPPSVKKSSEETEKKLEAKDGSQSGLPKRRTTMSAESINKRSYLKKDSHGTDARKLKSDKFLPVRPSIRVEKSSQGSSNKVIRETANRLIRTRNKSKVMALIGAFETVISIQKKSARVNISKAKKRISSSKTSR